MGDFLLVLPPTIKTNKKRMRKRGEEGENFRQRGGSEEGRKREEGGEGERERGG